MEKLHLPILIEIDEDGLYIVSCPLFNGCHSWGETVGEAMKNILEVFEMCLEKTKIENLNTFVGFRELEVVSKMQKLPAIESQELLRFLKDF
jgi:predicted RNase H-like HicB family nuclease